MNEAAATLVGLDVGDDVDIATLTPEQVLEEDYFPPRGPMLPLHVVGVVRGTDDVVEDAEGGFYASPALYDVVHGRVDEFTTYLGVNLVDDASVDDFDAALAGLIPPEQEYQTLSLEERSNAARDTISAVAIGVGGLRARRGRGRDRGGRTGRRPSRRQSRKPTPRSCEGSA